MTKGIVKKLKWKVFSALSRTELEEDQGIPETLCEVLVYGIQERQFRPQWIRAHDINSRAHQNVSLCFLENSIFSFKNMKILDWKQKVKYFFQVAPRWFEMSQFI